MRPRWFKKGSMVDVFTVYIDGKPTGEYAEARGVIEKVRGEWALVRLVNAGITVAAKRQDIEYKGPYRPRASKFRVVYDAHSSDRECEVVHGKIRVGQVCPGCGAMTGRPCGLCGGRRYHHPRCQAAYVNPGLVATYPGASR